MCNKTQHIRSLLAKATPGPWTQSGIDVLQVHHTTRDVWYLPRSEADTALTVAAINALPALLAVVEAAEVVNRQVWDGAEPKDAYAADCALSEALEGLNNNDKESK